MKSGKNVNLSQFLDADLICMELKAGTKMEGVEKLADLFTSKYPEKDKEDIIKTALEREGLGPTSMGRGFAFPHARTTTVQNLFLAAGINKAGMTETGPDGLPLKVIFLLITPRSITGLYLQVLAGLANFARRPGTLDKIVTLDNAGGLIQFVDQSDIVLGKITTVSDVMMETFATVSSEDRLSKATNYMFAHNIDGIPVVDSTGAIIGDIGEREILRAALPIFENILVEGGGLAEADPLAELKLREDQIKISDIMNRNVITVTENTPVVQAASLMMSCNVDRVLVVKDKKIIGIVTRASLVSLVTRG